MTEHNSGDRPYVDTQSLTDVDIGVYETIATLEFTGKPPTQGQIAAASDLDDTTLGKTLETLTQRHLLVRTDIKGQACYEPARRDWSTQPGQPEGPQRL
jgi:hypothetical protein